MRLLIKFPTRARPSKFLEVLDLYYKNLKNIDKCQFVISCDTDDTTMNNEKIKTKLNQYKNLSYFFDDNKSKVQAINNNLNDIIFDILLLASDDMVPQYYGYDELIRKCMHTHFPDTDGVLWFDDGFQHMNLNTLPIMGKTYFDRFNYIYNPSYQSLFCDTEFTIISKKLKKVKYFDKVIIKHDHYSISNYDADELYIKNDSLQHRDNVVFNRRYMENFPEPAKNLSHKYFIFVHDLEIIKYLESKQKFNALKNYQYVLLSENDFDIESCEKIIVAKNCKQNIESYKNYLQFTGWFCLVANKLIDTDYITLLEYDINFENDIDSIIKKEIIYDQLECYGYAGLEKTNSFLNDDVFSSGLIKFCQTQGIDHNLIINDKLNNKWIVTSNLTIKTKNFIEMIKSNLFINFLNFLKNDKLSGHFLERFVTLYFTLYKMPYRFIEKNNNPVLTHYAVDSHNTQGRHDIYKNYKNIL